MKFHAGLFISTIVLLPVCSVGFAHDDPGTTEAAIDSPGIQKPAEAEAVIDNPTTQKPSDAEAMQAAIRYVNPDGQLTIKKSELLAWGLFNEKQVYWPMKFRMTYIPEGSHKPRQNEYAVKLSKDGNGKWVATQHWAWRTETWQTDFK